MEVIMVKSNNKCFSIKPKSFLHKTFLKRRQGALSVEASIVLPLFLVIFMGLFYFIKIACTHIVVDHAVNQTAKQLAAVCYPVGFINEFEDDLVEKVGFEISSLDEEIEEAESYISNIETGDEDAEGIYPEDILSGSGEQLPYVLSRLLTGEVNEDSITSVLKTTVLQIFDDVKSDIINEITAEIAEKYYNMKSKVKYMAVQKLIKNFNSSLIDTDNISYIIVELPQSNTEYSFKQNNQSYIDAYEKINYKPDMNDVVIALEYKTTIVLPFIGKTEFTTTHVAVEKAWLKGSNGVYTVRDYSGGSDGSDNASGSEGSGSIIDYIDDSGEYFEEIDYEEKEIVYITRFGERYHKYDCRYLWNSRIAILKEEAEAQGKTKCKVCWRSK